MKLTAVQRQEIEDIVHLGATGHQNGSQCRHESHQEHQAEAEAEGEHWNKGSFNRRLSICRQTTIVGQNGA